VINSQLSNLPDNPHLEGYVIKNFAQFKFPWLNAQISARSKESNEEKIKYKNSKIANNKNNKVI